MDFETFYENAILGGGREQHRRIICKKKIFGAAMLLGPWCKIQKVTERVTLKDTETATKL